MAGRRADGSAFQMLLEGVAFKDMEPSNRVVFVTDVTDLENAVASSRQSKARLKAILDNAPVALLSLDLDGIIRSWNPAAARIFGRTEAQAVGSPGPGGHITAGNVKRMATGGLPHLRGELVEHARVDRTKVEVRILTATLLDPDGEPSELLVVAEDVTALALIDAERTRLVAAIDQSSESIVITDPAATIQYVNPAFERLTGYTRADAIGKNPRILQSGVQEPAFYQAMWAILKRGETWRGTFVNRARDGRLFEEEAAISPVFDSNGRLINYVAVKRDVTRERAADVALRRSEERYRNLVDFANDAIFIRDIDGRFIDANQTACERLGYTRDQLLTMSVADIDSPTDAAELADRTEAILRQGSAVFESAHVARNGTVIPTEMSSTVIEHAGRKAILSIARDITDRRRIQTALELSEAKFSTAFKTSPDSININRISDGLYLDISEGFTEMTGFTRADVQGKTSADISLWADSGAREKAVELLLADGALRNLEMRFRRKDGTVGLGLMSGRVIEVDGEACILSITRDITERKAAERRFEMLFNLASDAIMISEPGGRFVDVNRKACERLGYSRDELLAMSPADINAPEFAALAQAWTQDLLRNGSAFIATVHVRKDGTSIPVEISTTVVDLGGRTAILSIVRDVTERKSAEAAQRRSELKYSTAFRTFPDAVNITRLSDGRFLEINDGFSAMFRIRPGRGPGQDARRVRAVGRSDGACPAGGATSGRRVIRRCGGSVPPQRRQRGNRSDVGQDHGPRWREVHPGDHAQHHRPAPCPGAVPDALRVGQRRDLHPRRRGPVPRGEPDRLRPSWLHPR
jgi:PAS domain S-box-containing protein